MVVLNPTEISDDGVRRIAGLEGTVYHVYKDVAGVDTVCTGHVLLPGEDWSTVTREKCQSTLGRDLSKFVRCVLENVTAPYDQEMLDAAASLAFNIGCEGFRTSSVLRLWNDRQFEAAAQAFQLWAYAKVKQLDGTFVKKPVLIGRRMAESSLFLAGVALLRGELPTWGPPIAESVERANATLIDLRSTLHDGPAGLDEEERRRGDFLTDDGKLVLLPPASEEQLAA